MRIAPNRSCGWNRVTSTSCEVDAQRVGAAAHMLMFGLQHGGGRSASLQLQNIMIMFSATFIF